MDFSTAVAVGSVAVAGLIDWKGLNWIQALIAKRIQEDILTEPLVYKPGDSLESAVLD